jgi:hypothetical protein
MTPTDMNWWGHSAWKKAHYFEKDVSLCNQKVPLHGECTRYQKSGLPDFVRCRECFEKLLARKS